MNRYYKFYPTWPFNNSDLISNSILFEYTRLTLASQENYLFKSDYRSVLNELVTDESSACPVLKLADYVKYSDVYLYKFEQNRSKEFYDESEMVFGTAVLDESYSPEEKNLSKEMMKRWANFVIYDDPNGVEKESVLWPKYKSEGRFGRDKGFEQFLFSNDRIGPMSVDRLERCQLWNSLVPAQLDTLAGMKNSASNVDRKNAKKILHLMLVLVRKICNGEKSLK
ncbi:cholinesterase isoform X1 [Brachionus plicatilis]|uniref:Cholinesterase isoform X1 n=1 Tax=Brachionus plicatilis TaxID=10195 RepID=A0A3M7P3N8_BRAPC|nr:cholinesterase isoform X1 [Brachionus plicatilis]